MNIKVDLQAVGLECNFANWEKIKTIVNEKTNYPEKHWETLRHAKNLFFKKQEINIPIQVDLILDNGKEYYLLDGNLKATKSSLVAIFDCRSCDKTFKVEYNPPRCYLDSFLCKKCKKSIVHKCLDYRERYENTMIKLYGVTRPLKSPELHKHFTDTMNKKYGVSYSGQNPDSLRKTKEHTNFNGQSKGEIDLANTLKNIYGSDKIVCDKTIKINVGQNQWFYPDIIANGKIVIEYYGDYWHGNPEVYGPDDIISSIYKAKDVWEYDKIREQKIKNVGYRFIVVWEKDWKNKKDFVLEEISKWMK